MNSLRGFWFSFDYLLPVIRLREDHYKEVALASIAQARFPYLGVQLSIPVRGYFYFHQIVGYILVFFLIAALSGIIEPTQ
jgi:hypothetical protein